MHLPIRKLKNNRKSVNITRRYMSVVFFPYVIIVWTTFVAMTGFIWLFSEAQLGYICMWVLRLIINVTNQGPI